MRSQSFRRSRCLLVFVCWTSLFRKLHTVLQWIKVITKLPNSEQSYKGKVKTHNYINRQNQSTTEKLWRKFQIFIFLIVHINVNTGVFCLIISYLRIKIYNVLNYNNYSTDWSFALSEILLKVALNTTKPTNTIISSYDYQKVN